MKTLQRQTIMDNGGEAKQLKRFMQFDAPAADDMRIDFIITTESPVDRGTFYEILSCKETDCDISRLGEKAIPLLFNHDPNKIIGKVDRIYFEDGKCRGEAYLSKNAINEIEDIKSGILNSISVGYITQPKAIETTEINGKKAIRFGWILLEVSVVTIPADPKAGIGKRSLEQKIETNSIDIEAASISEAEQRKSDLVKLCEKHSRPDLVGMIIAGKDESEIREMLLNRRTIKQIEKETKMEKRFSLVNAIKAQVPGWERSVDATYEKEVSQEISKKSGKNATGLFVPFESLSTRGMTVANTGDLVATDLQDAMKPLYANLFSSAVGVRFLSGLNGDVAVPVVSSVQSYWITEGNAPTTSDMTVSQVTGSPKGLGCWTDISRKLLKQSSVSCEALITEDMGKIIGQAIDSAVISGSGSAGQPLGLLAACNAAGNSVMTIAVAGAPTFAEVMAFETKIVEENVNDDLKWVLSPAAYATFATTPKGENNSGFLLEDGKLCGRDYVVSSLVEGAILGAWNYITVGQWGGGVDVSVDPFSLSTSGGIRIVAIADVDVLVTRPEAFAYIGEAALVG